MLQIFLAEDSEIEYLFCGAPYGSETCLLFCNDLFCLWLESVYDDLQHDLTRMADKADGSVVLAQLQFRKVENCPFNITFYAYINGTFSKGFKQK